jgi:periplasmic divalent cation tolerance protein
VADPGGFRLALMTAPDREVAERMVQRLVEEGVVACGTILPGCTSIYRWQGAVERATEVQVLFKTTASGVDRLVRLVPGMHPYDVPELIVLPVEAGYRPYLEWIESTVDRPE